MATLNIESLPDDSDDKLRRRAKLLEAPPSTSILELRELGRELWQGIDVDEYIEQERAAWD